MGVQSDHERHAAADLLKILSPKQAAVAESKVKIEPGTETSAAAVSCSSAASAAIGTVVSAASFAQRHLTDCCKSKP